MAMAKQQSWRVVRTSGGYGVLKSTAGAQVSKPTVVRTTEASKRVSNTSTSSGR